jgi:serine/threonine protein kinase
MKVSICQFVELITLDPSRPMGVYDCYLVMRPLIETTMGAILGFELPDDDRITLCMQALDGLNFLHTNGCMHRDIKLDNILASPKPLQAVIIDFGCATWDIQSLDHGVGTIRYLAPEVLDIKYESSTVPYNRSVDIWSLGLTMYEFICRWRFRGEYITQKQHDLILQQSHWRPPVRGAGTQKLFDLVNLMITWKPENRTTTDIAIQTATASGLFQYINPQSPVPGSKRLGDDIHRETT